MGERLQDEGLSIDLGCAIVNQGLLLHKHLTRSPDSPISERHLRLFKEGTYSCTFQQALLIEKKENYTSDRLCLKQYQKNIVKFQLSNYLVLKVN